MTTIHLHIPENGTNKCGVFTLAGDVEWLQDMVPHLAQFAANAVTTLRAGNETWQAVGRELSAGLEAMNAGQSYEGKFVTVTFEGGEQHEQVRASSGA